MNKIEKQSEKVINRLLKRSESKIAKSYATALKEVNKEIALLYAKIGDEPSLVDAQKYNNLRNRQKSIATEINKLYNDIRIETLTLGKETFLESYYREAFNFEYQAQAKLGFGKVNPKVIEEAINFPASGRPIRERFKTNRAGLIDKIDEQIVQGLIRGDSYGDIAKRIKKRTDIDLNRALLTARTESHRIQMQAKAKAFDEAKERGVEFRKVWDSASDDRTRESHDELDGQVADEDGYFHYDGMTAQGPSLWGEAEMDVNCRCGVTTDVVGYEREGTTKFGESYEDWREEKGI